MNKPLLSVCIITYNHAQYIRQAIDSILAQQVNFRWELIVADDHSTDGTRDILVEYQKTHPDLVRLVLQKTNVGPETNWLDLLAASNASYVLYGEGDDYFTDPTKLQRQVDFLEAHPDFSMCFHPVQVIYDDKSRSDEIFPTPEQRGHKKVLGLSDLAKYNFIQTNSVMYRWQFVDTNIENVFPKNIIPGDWFLHLLHAQTGKIGFMDRVMAVYRRHSGGIWWDADNNINHIWQKYGLRHIRLYIEMLKLEGLDDVTRQSIVSKLQVAYRGLVSADSEYNEGLVATAAEQLPAATAVFIAAEVADQHAASQKAIRLEDALHLSQASLHDTQERFKNVQTELRLIRASRFWKMRNTIVRLLGKK